MFNMIQLPVECKADAFLNIHVQLSYNQTPENTHDDFIAGKTPDKVSYGFHHAEGFGRHITYSFAKPESRFMKFTRCALLGRLGFDAIHAWRNRHLCDRADVIWTMLESEHLAVSLIYLVRPWVRRKPLIAQNVWLFERLQRRRMVLSEALARRATVLMTHSKACVPIMEKVFPENRTAVMRFGISADAFPLTPPTLRMENPIIRIFSAGNDRTRDWNTLLAAFGGDSRFQVRIACNWLMDEDVAKFGNVIMIRNPTMVEFRELYRTADFVVVAMKPNIFSGITVALEAVASGAMVVCSDTGGVPTYFDPNEVLYVKPGDPKAMRDSTLALTPEIRYCYIERAQRRFVNDDYTTKGMIGRYISISRTVT